MKLKNTFIQGKMNKNVDERLLPKGQYPHAENIRVANTDSSDMGAIENSRGNQQLSSFYLTNAKTIGAFSDDFNSKIYYFVTSDEKDLVVEYNDVTRTNTILLESSNPNGVLNFSEDYLITGINKVINSEPEKDLLLWTDDLNPPRAINIEDSKNYSVDGFTQENISLIKNPPRFAPETTLTFSPSSLDNNLEDRFLSIAYRYRYKDGFVSALSSFSYYNFSPSGFDLDYQTMENEGMVNNFNAIRIGFNTGGEDVTDIEIVYKESFSDTLYLIDSFNKEAKAWGDDEQQSFTFSDDKKYQVLPQDELFRSYDNVPRVAKSQEIIGNRLVFGNYVEGYDMVDSQGNTVQNDYSLSLNSQELVSEEIPSIIQNSTRLEINFLGEELTKDKRIVFSMNLTSLYLTQVGDANFSFDFEYILTRDYVNADDLRQDPLFISFVEETMTSTFLDNFQFELPANTQLLSSNPFRLLNSIPASVNKLVIGTPDLTFRVDNTPTNPNDSDFTDNLMQWLYTSETEVLTSNFSSVSSLKSNRTLEVGVIYMDAQGRKSTVEVSDTNTLEIDPEFSNFKNSMRVTLGTNAPAWADRYKFAVKENKGDYFTIYTNIFYEDGLFRWVKLEGANVNKVKEGDTLIVKSDLGGVRQNLVKTRVIELATKEKDFIEGNTNPSGDDIIEESGLYMKIKPSGFDMNFSGATAQTFEGGSHLRYPVRTFTAPAFPTPTAQEPNTLLAGSTVRINIGFQARGSIAYIANYEREFRVNGDYPTVEDWFDAEVGDLGQFGRDFTWNGIDFIENGSDYGYGIGDADNRVSGWGFENNRFYVLAHRDGTASRKITTSVSFEIVFSQGTVIFETEPEILDTDIYYETEETFEIINGQHQGNVQNQNGGTPAIIDLGYFNCYAFSNGAESYRFKDAFNTPRLNNDLRPSSTSTERYSEIRRYADLTYSEPYNENSGVNGLNEFNLARANFKEDIDKRYGFIQKLHSRDTDLVVFQEDKVSKVLFQKDLLFNADGTSNVSSVENVLGQQIAYQGEYGISDNPESFAYDSYNLYFTDVKRGAILRLGLNGITEISKHGMTQYFRDLFRDLPDSVQLGGFDPYYDQYVVSTRPNSKGVVNKIIINPTVSFDETIDGWTSFHSYIPDFMIGLNNKFFSFRNGELYVHHSDAVDRNNFYGTSYPSKISLMVNDSPSDVKELQAISLEGNYPWNSTLTSYISNLDDFRRSTIKESEFKNKEGFWYAYARRDESNHFDSKSSYGIGVITAVQGNNITVNGFNSSITTNDVIVRGSDLQSFGSIVTSSTDSGTTLIELTDAGSLAIGDFVMGTKNSRIEGANLRGYTMRFDLEINKNDKVELFAVNSEVMKSFS